KVKPAAKFCVRAAAPGAHLSQPKYTPARKFSGLLHFKIVSFIFKLVKKQNVLMKARLKSIILSALGVASVFTTVTVSSCNNDPCKSIVCAYGGTCADGDCIC